MGEDLKTLARLQLTEDRIAEASKARDSLVEQVEPRRHQRTHPERNEVRPLRRRQA